MAVCVSACLRAGLSGCLAVCSVPFHVVCTTHHAPWTYSIGTYSIGIADAPPAPFYSLHLISLIAHRRLLSETKAPSAASITVILRRAMAVTAPKR